jgi:3-deoxy-D-arabino-heptulosonate 7-phosphate (DAHP) synthase class II
VKTSPNVSAGRGGLAADLDARYETVCDPRLNGRRSIDLAFRVAELMRADRRPPLAA